MEKAENEDIPKGRDQTDIRLNSVMNDVFRGTTTIKAKDEDAYLYYQDTYGHNYEPPLVNYDDTQIPDFALYPPSRTHKTPRSLQTVTPSGQAQENNIAPPLLPAFLITGILLGAVVFIIVWRHYVERRRSVLRSVNAGEDEDVWGVNAASEGDRFGERPKMWDAYVPEGGPETVVKEKWKGWENVMPLSATPFFAAPKPQQPRYLIPSDRPTSFMTRMFGGGLEGYRLRPRPQRTNGTGTTPEISNVAYTNRQWGGMGVGMRDYDSGKGVSRGEEDVIENVQLSFVIAMPSERHSSNRMSRGERMSRETLRRRDSKDDDQKEDKEGRGEKSMEGGGEKAFLKNSNLRMSSELSAIHGEDTFPELCLGSLMIPYG